MGPSRAVGTLRFGFVGVDVNIPVTKQALGPTNRPQGLTHSAAIKLCLKWSFDVVYRVEKAGGWVIQNSHTVYVSLQEFSHLNVYCVTKINNPNTNLLARM